MLLGEVVCVVERKRGEKQKVFGRRWMIMQQSKPSPNSRMSKHDNILLGKVIGIFFVFFLVGYSGRGSSKFLGMGFVCGPSPQSKFCWVVYSFSSPTGYLRLVLFQGASRQ